MTQIKFGYKQRKNPTPQKINNLFDLISALLGITCAFFTTAAFITHDISDIVTTTVNGLLIPLCPVLKRYFGVVETVQEEEEVPEEEKKEEAKP